MTTPMPDNLDEQLSAYLDDELRDAERAQLERLIAADPDVRARLDALRRTIKLVQSLPRHNAPPALLDDLTAQAERQSLLGDEEPLSASRLPGRRSVIRLLATAALVTITLGGGLWVVVQVAQEPANIAVLTQVTRKETPPHFGAGRGGESVRQSQDRIRGLGLKGLDGKLEAGAELDGDAAAPGPSLESLGYVAADRPETARKPRAELPAAPPALIDRALAERSPAGEVRDVAGARPADASTREPEGSGGTDAVPFEEARNAQPQRYASTSQHVAPGWPIDMELRVDCANQADRQAAVVRLGRFLQARAVVWKRLTERRDATTGDRGLRASPDDVTRKLEADTAGQEQEIVATVQVSDLNRLVDSLIGAPESPNRISVKVGPLAAAGPEQVKRLLAFAPPPRSPGAYRRTHSARTAGSTETKKTTGTLLDIRRKSQLPAPPPMPALHKQDRDATGRERKTQDRTATGRERTTQDRTATGRERTMQDRTATVRERTMQDRTATVRERPVQTEPSRRAGISERTTQGEEVAKRRRDDAARPGAKATGPHPRDVSPGERSTRARPATQADSQPPAGAEAPPATQPTAIDRTPPRDALQAADGRVTLVIRLISSPSPPGPTTRPVSTPAPPTTRAATTSQPVRQTAPPPPSCSPG